MLLQVHAKQCQRADCPVPRCKELREMRRRAVVRQEDQRRVAYKNMVSDSDMLKLLVAPRILPKSAHPCCHCTTAALLCTRDSMLSCAFWERAASIKGPERCFGVLQLRQQNATNQQASSQANANPPGKGEPKPEPNY